MIFLAMILGLLPGLIWIFFYLQEDFYSGSLYYQQNLF